MIEHNDYRMRRVIMACELYCCLLPQCEALRICRLGFPIATIPYPSTSFKLSYHGVVFY